MGPGRNLLGGASSPYLRQHANNPVHWQQWGPEALAQARDRDVPILLSIGYAACHWCHVMAHESFEDDATAEVMNNNFVCVKVDREERPDLDAVYMNATVAMTGQGGWPMTCFLTPGGQPFYCGTYYPPQPRGGMPSFPQLLEAISRTWLTRREDVESASDRVTAALASNAAGLPDAGVPVTADLLDEAVVAILADEDQANGGFGGAPKFPPSALLEGLLRHSERTGHGMGAIVRAAEAMARGGIHDQLAGGFARYSVDAEWVVPHFEKMLYDNALLLRFYAHLARRAEGGLALRIAQQTAEFLLRDLRTAEGGFASALDADTEGEEGLTYVWSPEQLIEVLGFEDGVWAAGLLAVSSSGTFEHGLSVLQLPGDPEDVERWERVRTALLEARSLRPQPSRDDKVVTAWNGMAITALAEGGAALGQAHWVQAAADAATFLLEHHVVAGRLRRVSLGGVVGDPAAVLEDHAALGTGLLALFQATGQHHWLASAQQVIDLAVQHFGAPQEPGSWFDTADDAEVLVTRPRDAVDGATPAGASLLAEALLTLAPLVQDSAVYAELADQALARAAILLQRAPRSAGHWLAVAEAAVCGPLQVAIAHAEGMDPAPLVQAARWNAPGGTVIVAGSANSSALLRERHPVAGAAAAYVCRGQVCDLPVTSVRTLEQALLA